MEAVSRRPYRLRYRLQVERSQLGRDGQGPDAVSIARDREQPLPKDLLVA